VGFATQSKEQRAMKNLDTMLDNRIRVARRWHGLKRTDDIADFVVEQTDLIEAVKADAELFKDTWQRMIKDVITADASRLRKLRRMFGNELVDKILELRDQARGAV
jgi:hypothetical protein